MDNSASSVDLTQKYHKLATEYSKMRTHTAILKKAIADEQARNVDMTDHLKEKDQLMRKLEQEIECLNFRNMQLMKRVGILQEDLSAIDDTKTKRNKNKSQSSPLPLETSSILDAELQSRIQENEKLHQLVYVTEMEQKKVIDDISDELSKVQEELTQQRAVWNDKLNTREATIKQLTDQRAKIELKMKQLERELQDTQLKESTCKEELEKVQFNRSNTVEESNNNVFVTHSGSSPLLDTPIFSMSYWKESNRLLAQFGGHLSELLRKLSDLHMYMEQHIQLYIVEHLPSQNECDILSKFIQHLHEHTAYLKPIETSYNLFQSKVASDSTYLWSDSFSSSTFICDISKYVSYLQKLIPYLSLSIQMKLKTCENVPRLTETLKCLEELSIQTVQGFTKLEKWLTLLCNYNSLKCKKNPKTDPNFIMSKLVETIRYLAKNSDEIRKQLSCKIAFEEHLEGVSSNVKTTDQCVLSCLVGLNKILKKMLCVMEEKPAMFDRSQMFGSLRQTPCVHGAVVGFRIKARRYVESLKEENHPQIPYCLAIQNQVSVQGYNQNQEVLRQQFAALEKKVTKLEQEKEHWMLECQLSAAKHQRKENNKFENKDETDRNGEMESCVREHIGTLVCKLQMADTKTVAFQSECNAVHQRLEISESQCQRFKAELNDTKCNFDILKEELQATVKNYEDQLGTMTEHLANMNEKLTLQKEEIDTLKHSNVKKSRSK